MKTPFKQSGKLYLITDRLVSGLNHFEMTRRAIHAGIRIVQIREKNMAKKDLFREVVLIRNLTLRYGITLIINDYVDIALTVNADGIHLGQEDMPIQEARKILGKNKIVGISTHSLRQALDAQKEGADYIGYGPIFKTATKNTGKLKGPEALVEIKKHIKIPVAAIGGINILNAPDVLKKGADALAVASGILSGDIEKNAKKFLSVINRSENPSLAKRGKGRFFNQK